VVIEGRQRKGNAEEHIIMCSIGLELGSQFCIKKYTVNLVHY